MRSIKECMEKLIDGKTLICTEDYRQNGCAKNEKIKIGYVIDENELQENYKTIIWVETSNPVCFSIFDDCEWEEEILQSK
jgi:hypothetical protein